MLNLEDFMNIRDLKQQGWSVSAIAAQLDLDRKTVRKHLVEAPQPYKRENPAPCKIDPYRPFLRERWEAGVHNARKLLDEIRVRGYDGGYSQLKLAVTPWREEGRERAFVRFETGPGEQSQMDLGPLRQLGRPPSLRVRSHAVLLAHALRRVHPEPGHPSLAGLHGAQLPLFRRRDRNRAHRPHEDRIARSKRQ